MKQMANFQQPHFQFGFTADKYIFSEYTNAVKMLGVDTSGVPTMFK